MMIDTALALAREGFYVFPLTPGKKSPPLITDFPHRASRQPGVLVDWWARWPDANIGISTTTFGENEALLVVDVDCKEGQHGLTELLRLELEGWDLPDTRTQFTPSGGRHLVYRCRAPVRQGASVVGRNLDVRSRGGYIVAVGSRLDGQVYAADTTPIADAPEWLVERCGTAEAAGIRSGEASNTSTIPSAEARVTHYLINEAPIAVEGQNGDDTTYRVACRVKDLGATNSEAVQWMLAHWNSRCVPPWTNDDLRTKIDHAYRYGVNPPGAAAPEVEFQDPFEEPEPTPAAKHPILKLNEHFAFVTVGGGAHILWETTDLHNRYKLEHLSMSAFHAKFAPETIMIGKKVSQISEEWLKDPRRREYEGVVFQPGNEVPKRFYNLWRGFAYVPAKSVQRCAAVDTFLEHAKANVCRGDDQLFRWLIGYFAHLVQRPGEKPLVALVFRGAKGVGKNALVERIGALLGGHFLLTSNRRYLVGNFNGHLENCLLFALDEAFWSGDKQAEGALKDLITGREHVIEHKGKEPYTVANKTRVVIIGNEDWLVPASNDERRFAVFDVGDGRKQDRAFFQDMREGMEQGGYAVLLRYLLDYDLAGIDLNEAPSTEGLRDQKTNSLDPFHQWWLDCLEEGRLIGAEFSDWPGDIECDRFRSAFRRYVKERNIRSRIPEDRTIGRLFKQCCPIHEKIRFSKNEDGAQPYAYRVPPLDRARVQWDQFIGHVTEWRE